MADDTPKEEPAENVIVALSRVMRDLPAIGKGEKMQGAGQGGYSYRGIEAITREAQGLCARHGVVFVPRVVGTPETVNIMVNGKPWTDTRLLIEYDVHGPGDFGDKITVGPIYTIGRDNSDKGANKCMTQAFKYALLQTLMIADAKDDSDQASHGADAEADRAIAEDAPEAWVDADRRAKIAHGVRTLRDQDADPTAKADDGGNIVLGVQVTRQENEQFIWCITNKQADELIAELEARTTPELPLEGGDKDATQGDEGAAHTASPEPAAPAGADREGSPSAPAPTPEPTEAPSEKGQRSRFGALAKTAELSDDDRHDIIQVITGGRTRTSTETTKVEMDLAIKAAKLAGAGSIKTGYMDKDGGEVLGNAEGAVVTIFALAPEDETIPAGESDGEKFVAALGAHLSGGSQ